MADEKKHGPIAIKFGTSSKLSKPSSRPPPPSTLGKRPRSHAWANGASDSEGDDDDGRRGGRHEAITGFGEDGAETERSRREDKKKKAYVIPRQPNKDWKAEAKAQARGSKSQHDRTNGQNGTSSGAVETEPADQDKGLKWGLTIKDKDDTNGATSPHDDDSPAVQDGQTAEPSEQAPKSHDEEAMDALLGNKPSKPDAVIPAVTEDDAYQRDVETAGADSTLQDYEEMPVEEFGAALLRGMGWDGVARGPKPRDVKRRQNHLGLGAKELKGAEDLGGWNQKNGGKKNSRPMRLDEYNRERSKKKDGRGYEDSYKREKERERDRDSDRYRDRDHDRHRDRHRDYDRDDRHRRR